PPADASTSDVSDVSDVSVPDADAIDAPACGGCARDWTAQPAVVEVDGATELWVTSDAHGDYDTLTKLLAGGEIIAGVPSSPSSVVWTAGSAVLVVVGDVIDKGPDAPDIIRMLATLRTDAKVAGGRVIVTMGNHEAEFLADPNNSKATSTDGLDPELQSIGLDASATANGADDIGAFLRGLPIAARVDDWFFVHAGDTGGQSIAALESAIETGVNANGFGATILSDPSSMLEAKLSSSAPQWWDATNDPAALLGQWTQALGVKHLVMGHQPGSFSFADKTTRPSDAMFEYYGGLIFFVDTGMSVGVDATGGALLHVTSPGVAGESWKEIFPNGSSQTF
ncbi:MAG TPA: metallophosphoesterase, partial [Polyangiaceae bacterium]|nr:metallophosphoesterase [Polyangiaceae bacterium]